MDNYEELQTFNSSISEQLHALLELFLPMTKTTNPETCDVFFLCLATLWNDFVVGNPVATSALHNQASLFVETEETDVNPFRGPGKHS